MKLTRYQFEKSLQEATTESSEWLKEEYNRILTSDKDYTAKADYIGYSILSIDEKVSVLDEQIKEMQTLKKQLKAAKELALGIGAEVFENYGVTKIEGAGISSITLTGEKESVSHELEILDEDAVISKGYVMLVIDTEALIKDLSTLKGKYELLGIAQLKDVKKTTPARLKVNKRRSSLKDAA